MPSLDDNLTRLEEWLVQDLTSRIAQVMESMTGEPATTSLTKDSPDPATSFFWWEQEFSLAAGARLWVGATQQTWSRIGCKVFSAAGIEDGDEENLKSTYQEVLNQSLSSLAQAISRQVRREVNCSSGKEAPPDAQNYWRIDLELEGQHLDLYAVPSTGLAAALAQDERKRPALPEPPPSAPPAPDPDPVPGKSFDLLLDVELPVSVSFGRAQLPLKDALKLTTGSIVELNRSVSEPVEIIVNNCVIARGQVVVVEGNFGVRIQQVISRQERLRTLR